MKDIKVGIVGLGRLGSVHAQNLAFKIPGCKLVAACSLEQKELDWAKDYLKVEYTTTDYKKMVDEADIEAVVIVSSSPEHCWMIEYALDAGKHVFTDKPLGCSLEECKRAEAAVERHPDKLFFLGFMRRYDPSYADAKAQIDAGHIGKPYLVKATGLDPEALVESCIKFSKTSGGIFIDAASHDIDLMRWFLGGEVTEVYAAGTTFKHPEFAENGDTETGMAMLKFDNGTVAFLHVGRTAPHGYHTETENRRHRSAHSCCRCALEGPRHGIRPVRRTPRDHRELPAALCRGISARDGRFHRLHPEGTQAGADRLRRHQGYARYLCDHRLVPYGQAGDCQVLTHLTPGGTLSPLDTPPVPQKPEGIPPSPLHGRGGSGHVSRGSGVKVRQSWTFTGIFMRRSAERLSCLFCRRQNAAGD